LGTFQFMKLKLFLVLFFFNISFTYSQQNFKRDSLKIAQLNRIGFKLRLSNPNESIKRGTQALHLAQKADFKKGMADAYRVIGIGYFYINQNDNALSNYQRALTLYKELNNQYGEAKIYNNIGNLYREIDYKRALEYFNKTINISRKLNNADGHDLIANCYLNIGLVYIRTNNYHAGINLFKKSLDYFIKNKNVIGTSAAYQNLGLSYYKLHDLNKAKLHLNKAVEIAKANGLYFGISSSGLTLALAYAKEGNYKKAEDIIQEGSKYARIIKDQKLVEDYVYVSYELEQYRKNYKQALVYLKEIYRIDSIAFKKVESRKIALQQEEYKHIQRQKETELLLERQKTNWVIFLATVIVLALSFVVIFLLVMNSRKRAKTFKQLQELNEEISLQKENLNRINLNQEAIIKERTADLETKNYKLSQYSSHLSHEIRSPVATIKGLLILEQDDLIDHGELVQELKKCVDDIDHKLLNINQMLHNPQYKTFVSPEQTGLEQSGSKL